MLSRAFARLREAMRNDQLILALLALVTGLGVGVLIVEFRHLIGFVQWVFYGTADEFLVTQTTLLSWWHILLAPAIGGLIVGPFIKYLTPDGRPLGMADAIESAALHRGRMPALAGIGAAVASALSIGAGGSLGREGPAVHIGATFCAWISARLGLNRPAARTLLGCGAAAAVAASFNAPLAGALFANEVIVGHYALSAFAPIVIASVTGTVVSRAFYGDFPAFEIPQEFVNLPEFPIFALLGLIAGVVAALMTKGTGWVAAGRARLPLPAWLHPAVGGLAVGAIAIFFPEVLGVGYEATIAALDGRYALGFVLLLAAAKLIATTISLGSGLSGGIFSPALVIGAMLGSGVGLAVEALFPGLASSPGSYAIVGMGGVAAAALGAPISTTLIVFELSGDYAVAMAVMLAAVLASVVMRGLTQQHSFFTWQLFRRGVDLVRGTQNLVQRNILVREVMTRHGELVGMDVSLADLRGALQQSETGYVFVIDNKGSLYGTVTLADLSEAAFDHAYDTLLIAGDVARRPPCFVLPGDNLEDAIYRMHDHGVEQMAVVDDPENKQFIGSLQEVEALVAENQALLDLRRTER